MHLWRLSILYPRGRGNPNLKFSYWKLTARKIHPLFLFSSMVFSGSVSFASFFFLTFFSCLLWRTDLFWEVRCYFDFPPEIGVWRTYMPLLSVSHRCLLELCDHQPTRLHCNSLGTSYKTTQKLQLVLSTWAPVYMRMWDEGSGQYLLSAVGQILGSCGKIWCVI